MKKYFILFFLVMQLISFTSCVKSISAPSVTETTQEGVTNVVFWNLFSGDDGIIISNMVEQFNEEHNEIYVENITQDWEQYYTKLRIGVFSESSPDVAISHKSRLIELHSLGILTSIDSALDEHGVELDFNKFTQSSSTGIAFDNQNYAVPFDSMFLVMLYNKSVLDEAGLLSENGTPVLEDGIENFTETLKRLEEHSSDIFPVEIQYGGSTTVTFWYSIYRQITDKPFLSEDGKTLTLDHKAAVEAAEIVQQIYSYAPPVEGIAGQLFQSGKSAFLINGTYVVESNNSILGEDLGVMSFPLLGDNEAVWTESHVFILPNNENRDDKTEKAALEFINWMCDHNMEWAVSGAIPAVENTLSDPSYLELPHRSGYIDSTEFGAIFPSSEKIWFMYSPEIQEPFDKLIRNNANPEEIINELTERVNAVLSTS